MEIFTGNDQFIYYIPNNSCKNVFLIHNDFIPNGSVSLKGG